MVSAVSRRIFRPSRSAVRSAMVLSLAAFAASTSFPLSANTCLT
ncbi:hypothetical protein 2203_scaffold802_00050 [Bacteriophage sp.]|nr:hypothetical protein 2203_scaffold802_00050 [Bacteriophage sp.]